jgi:mono/diheme cytochrome c family protein
VIRSRLLAAALALGLTSPALAQDDGRELFAKVCAACHREDGRGVPGVYPPLAGHIGRFAGIPAGRSYLARVLMYGLFGSIRVEDRPYNGLMPPQPAFSDAQIAAVLNYAPAGYHDPKASFSQMTKERAALLEQLAEQSSARPAIPRITGVAQDFARQCQGCHGANGMGARGAIPRLRDFVGYFTHLPEGRDYLARVPGVVFAPLPDERLAAVLNWTLETFSAAQIAPDFTPFTAAEVARNRKHPIGDVRATRERLIVELRAKGLVASADDGLTSAAVAGPH